MAVRAATGLAAALIWQTGDFLRWRLTEETEAVLRKWGRLAAAVWFLLPPQDEMDRWQLVSQETEEEFESLSDLGLGGANGGYVWRVWWEKISGSLSPWQLIRPPWGRLDACGLGNLTSAEKVLKYFLNRRQSRMWLTGKWLVRQEGVNRHTHKASATSCWHRLPGEDESFHVPPVRVTTTEDGSSRGKGWKWMMDATEDRKSWRADLNDGVFCQQSQSRQMVLSSRVTSPLMAEALWRKCGAAAATEINSRTVLGSFALETKCVFR